MLEQLGKYWEARFNGFNFFSSFLDMRQDVQEIFRATPHEKQVMMFSATLSEDVTKTFQKFMQDICYTLAYGSEPKVVNHSDKY